MRCCRLRDFRTNYHEASPNEPSKLHPTVGNRTAYRRLAVSPSKVKRVAEGFKAGAATAYCEIYASGNEWRWWAWRSSEKVASSGEWFVSESNAKRAADNVRDNAGSATVE